MSKTCIEGAMPLTRYEIRNEYSLANPDLYRAAAKDDPEGLLEGVAMAGLVGIVRQLGDLAEFAAEVFHDLHEEVLATAARGHELLIRVQQLEAELPLVEKMMVAESNYVNFAYNPGVEWHANIHNDQNHFTQGDLPRFIRNAYEDCRGPPRLFLLDKFDVAGAGACLKRYTDPSFFRMEWASSELMKAEKEQQDKKARRIKKKGRRQRNGEIRDSFLAAHMQPRMHHVPSEVENTASTSIHSRISNSWHSSEQEGLASKPQGREHQPLSSRLLIPEQEGPNLKASTNALPQDIKFKEVSVKLNAVQDFRVNEASTEPSDSKLSPAKFDSEKVEMAGITSDNGVQRTDSPTDLKISEDVADDFASETDNYMDALTTMDSEAETDSEVKTIVELDGELGQNDREGEATVQSKQATSDYLQKSGETDFVTEDGVLCSQNTPEESDISERLEPAFVVNSPEANLTEERRPTFVNDSCVSPSIQQSRPSTPSSGSSTSMPPLEKSVVNSEEILESESAEGVPETPETPEANEYDSLQVENLTSAFHQLPEPVVPLGNGSQNNFPERLGALSAHLGVKNSALISREFSSARVDNHSLEDSESDASEGIKESSPHSMKESSPHSSANSSIQPMKWAIDFSRHPNNVLDSDDELEGMQVSSSSSTSSALSSPRPSTLATTVFNMDYDKKLSSLLSPQGSIKSSSESLLGISPHSLGSTSPHSPVSLMGTGVNPSVMSPHVGQTSSHISPSYLQSPDNLAGLGPEPNLHRDMAVPAQNQSLLTDEPEHFPPPPPLPPLEWRMTRRFGGILSSSIKASESSARSPTSQSPLSEPHESSQAFKPFTFLASQSIPTVPDELVHASKRSTSWNGDSEDFSMHFGELQELSNKAAPAPQNLPVVQQTSTQAFKSFSAKLPTPSNVPERLDQLEQPFKASSMGLPSSHDVLVKTPEASTTGYPTSQSILNDSVQSYRSSTTESVDGNQNDSTTCLAPIEDHNVEGFSPPSEFNPPAAITNKVSTDSSDDDCAEPLFPPLKDKKIPSPPRLEESSKGPRPPLSSLGLGSDRGSRPMIGLKVERKDSLIAAIASHDKSTLKKVPEWSQSSRTPRSDDREVLLEQIRTGSFSLRHTKVEKPEAPRPVTNINVAAILEKANAIRQAFAGSDEDDDDDDWSDS